jgi:hypothetical protein
MTTMSFADLTDVALARSIAPRSRHLFFEMQGQRPSAR